MVSDVKSTRNVWVLLDDLTAKHLANLLEDVVENHAKNLEAIDRVLALIDNPSTSEERARLIKMSNDETEKLTIYREILGQVHLADTLADASSYLMKPEALV